MKNFAKVIINFVVLVFIFVFPNLAFASTTPFRSARIITTDGFVPYTNLGNCSVTDLATCDRGVGPLHGNLYFKDFGNYDDFGMPHGSIISKVSIRVTGKANVPVLGLYVGLSSGTSYGTYGDNCQLPSDLWTLYQLNSTTIKTQTFVTSVTAIPNGSVDADCLKEDAFENKSFIWRINYSSYIDQTWSANIDNFEIAFDYNPPISPTPTPTPTKTPLILIPGIGGSELKTAELVNWSEPNGHGETFTHTYPAQETVWVNTLEAAKPGDDDYFDVLRLQTDGQKSQANLALTGNLFAGAYKGTIDFFTSSGYTLGKDLFVFPYDWRKDVAQTASLLDQKIDSVKQQTGSAKVDIVAHSMGGLVARNYIVDASWAQKVRKLFTLGTPHLGSVDYIKNLMYGGCFTKPELQNLPYCIGLTNSEVKDVIQNLTGGYELAPTQTYFTFYSGEDNKHPYPFADIRDIDSNGVTGKLNYYQIKTLLTNLGHNTSLFSPSETFHNLDNNLTNTNGVEVTNIVGSGLSTLGQIIEKYSINFLGIKIPKRDEIAINGDKTVPLFSASLFDSGKNISLLGNAKVFYTKQEHGSLVSSGPALNLVKNILANNNQLPAGVSNQPYSFSGTGVSVHSPVNIHVYDTFGNHTGPTIDGDFEANIPGSSYDTLEDAKFIFLSDDGKYTVKLESTGTGSFDFKIRKFENDVNTSTILYNNIPLTNTTKAQTILDTSLTQPPSLQIDQDGDGTIDKEIAPTNTLSENATYDETPPQTAIVLSGLQGNSNWYKSDVIVTLTGRDEVNGSGIDKVEYSQDNGQTVQIYTNPFTISQEGVAKIKFRSIDKAGNEEIPQETEFKIDKTLPEAKIFIDQDKQDLVIVGTDANPTTVTRLDTFYFVTDAAGNSLKLDVRDRDKEKQDRFGIFTLTYNDIPPIVEPDNHYNVSYQGEKNKLNVKEQNFEINGQVKIRIQYDSKTNKSTIITRESGAERVKEIKDGLVLLQLTTNNGILQYSY